MKLRQIWKKYNSLSIAVKASLWFTVCSVLQKGMSFLTVPFFTRIMTTEEYGQVTIYQSWIAIFTIICTMNVTYGGFYNGMIKFKEDKEGYTSSVLILTTIMTSIWAAIYLLFQEDISVIVKQSNLFIILMFIEILSKATFDLWITRQKYDFNYKMQTIITLICSLLSPIFGVILIMTIQDKVLGKVLGSIIVYLFVGIVLYFSILKKGKKIVDYRYWKFVLGFCIPLLPHFMAQTILSQSDRIMISNMVGTSAAAIYGFSYNIAMILTIVYQAINNSFIPWLYQQMEKKEYTRINQITQYLLLLVAILVILVTFFAPEAVLILGGKKYYEAIYMIPPVVASVFFMFLYSTFFNVEAYFEKSHFAMIASIIASVLNIILNLLFIPMYGYAAAGYTTLICYIIMSIAHYICLKIICNNKKIEESIYSIKIIIVISLMVILFSVVATVLYRYFVIRYILIGVMFVTFLLNKNMIKTIIKKLKNN